MNRTIPWIIAVVALAAFGASFSELHKARDRYWKLVRFQSADHMHREAREFIIRATLEGLDNPIIVIGDSITEMARLPETVDGKPIVNAGIGGETIETFETIAPVLIHGFKPSLIVVALGTNNGSSIKTAYDSLLTELKKLSPRLLAIGVTPQDNADLKNSQIKASADSSNVPFIEIPLPEGSVLSDHVHLNASGYKKWTPSLVTAISAHIS